MAVPPMAGTPCPQCQTPMPVGAVLCVQCGYSTQTGKKNKAADAPVSKSAAAARTAGTFLLGIAFSSIGALIGAAIWTVVAMTTGYSIGWIAWGVGVLAGIGMKLGYRNQSTSAGVAAASVALAGVLVAKVAIFGFVMYAVITGDTNDIDMQREYVKGNMTYQILEDRGISTEDYSEEEWESAYDEVSPRVDSMSDEEIREKWQAFRDAEEAEFDAAEAEQEELGTTNGEPIPDPEYEEIGGAEAAGAFGALLVAFFISMFGLFDLLFVFLAVSSAYKIAGRGAQVSET